MEDRSPVAIWILGRFGADAWEGQVLASGGGTWAAGCSLEGEVMGGRYGLLEEEDGKG